MIAAHEGTMSHRKALMACAVLLFGAMAPFDLPAQGFKTLATFDGPNGAQPGYLNLVQGRDGNLYGTTGAGGANSLGTVFKISPNGVLTTLYSFCTQTNCVDGNSPNALALGSDGNFYGTTSEGGVNLTACQLGCGTVFKITPQGVLTTLHSFDGTDGYFPVSGLMQGADGNFYGTTTFGNIGPGTVFKITPSGVLTTLHNFVGPEGASPWGGLVQGTDLILYGTTRSGGTYNEGTVFKITPGGALTTLYSFCSQTGCPDGYLPVATLVQATDGNFYGTTFDGGISGCQFPYDCGTLFQITPAGKLTTLHQFDATDGANPSAALMQATDGNLYGTTYQGGDLTCGDPNEPFGCGTIFKITLSGVLTTLHDFCVQSGCADGQNPYGGVVQATNGVFYGVPDSGGDINCERAYGGCGTVFALDVGLNRFVETNPRAGTVGTKVGILGTDLTGATAVAFNGTAAQFEVISSSLIETTVPSGATTGMVRVTTPGGPVASNVAFDVLP
jgi:uncharacterized repeat protein (TIGR03803 family)